MLNLTTDASLSSEIFDDEQTGIAVRIRHNGRRSWIVPYRSKSDGKTRTYTIG
jgi:hypothetical protein